ncbi:hypothetical protein Sste5344_010607 [Sporothrix stenoceras]
MNDWAAYIYGCVMPYVRGKAYKNDDEDDSYFKYVDDVDYCVEDVEDIEQIICQGLIMHSWNYLR